MTPYLIEKAVLLAAFAGISSSTLVYPRQSNQTCSEIRQRVPWTSLTDNEKAAYIQADLCLINSPSKSGFEGAVTRWDDIQYPHVYQTVWAHGTGQFLPFHRYYMTVHERLVRDECGYTGNMPYWDEIAEIDDITTSALWGDDDSHFGSNGQDEYCVWDGPFANLTLRWLLDASTEDHCLTRNWSQEELDKGTQPNIDKCNSIDNYTDAWLCWSQNPHSAGHGGIGGIMSDGTLSPGDPTFYLHHSYLDKLWWEWQNLNESRLYDMGGPNLPTFSGQNGTTPPSAAFTDYFGDGGNTTTLNHVLYMFDLAPNVTVGDIMDIRGPVICSEYV
ncbi:amino acid transporter [Xylaria grammica]|nr:amino acid transporter [Xylaria grammica]